MTGNHSSSVRTYAAPSVSTSKLILLFTAPHHLTCFRLPSRQSWALQTGNADSTSITPLPSNNEDIVFPRIRRKITSGLTGTMRSLREARVG